MDNLINFCKNLIKIQNSFVREPDGKTKKNIITDAFKSGYLTFDKSSTFMPDPKYTELQNKYNQIVSSFNYKDVKILINIALDLIADLYYNKAELLTLEEFVTIQVLYQNYLTTPEFIKKIRYYAPDNAKVQDLLNVFNSDDSPENYNKHLLCIILFLNFEKSKEDVPVKKEYLKPNEYYSSCYGALENNNYRNSVNIDILEKIQTALLKTFLPNDTTIIDIISIIHKMTKLYIDGSKKIDNLVSSNQKLIDNFFEKMTSLHLNDIHYNTISAFYNTTKLAVEKDDIKDLLRVLRQNYNGEVNKTNILDRLIPLIV